MQYTSTRATDKNTDRRTFLQILLEGLSPDGGLYVPTDYPRIDSARLDAWRTLSYAELAFAILEKFATDVPAAELKALVDKTYTRVAYPYARRDEASDEITPLRVLERKGNKTLCLLGLSNGPTLAFKDMAMQLLGNLFEYELVRQHAKLNILGATSGDTGSAAEYAMRGKKGIRVFMLSPHGKMSDFQTAQMFSLHDENIFNIAIEGVFDDCQDIVKAVSRDLSFKTVQKIGTINSINWARVVAQVVYYFRAYLLATDDSRQRVSFTVPSGNFGNVCAGHIARMMGLPIDKLVVATNENDVLDEFFRTGVYRVRKSAETWHTSSPSMDISKASNFERFMYDLLGRDGARVGKLFEQIEEKGFFDLSGKQGSDGDELSKVGDFGFVSGKSCHADRIETIRSVKRTYGIVIDTHTADGVKVAREHQEDGVPMIVLETAQAAKFNETIREALGEDAERPDAFRDIEKRPRYFTVLPASADRVKQYIADRTRGKPAPMKIALRFFASVRVALNTSAETVDVPEDVRTVGDVRRFLVARGGVWAEALGEGKVLRMAYEQRMVDESERIAEGGEVAFFPPVTGGCNEKPRSVCFGAGSVHRRSAATTLLQQRLSPRSTTTAPLYSREEKMQENGVRVPYTLGVDVGMASVGTALLADGRFLNLFVRTFDKAETDKNGESLNKIRRDARLIRRRIRRRSHRLLRLCRRMKKEGIIAAAVPAAFANLKRSPWELRCLGLDEKLSSAEWASVLYHIVKHRGFLSNRKSEAKADEDVGRMLSGIEANRKRMGEKRYRTIGEMFFRDEEFITKRNKRGEYRLTISRLDLEKELKLLFERQREYGNPYTNSVFEENVQELLMQRRPTLSGNALLDKVGPCTFETGEKRAPKSCHHAERFVWLTKLNNLRIIENGKSRALRDGERDALLELPFTLSKLTYQQVRRKLELDDKAVFNISYRANEGGKSPESGTFFEAKFFHALRKAYENGGLHDAWKRDRADRGRLDNLAYAVTCYKDDDDIRAYLREKGVEEKIIEAALSCSFTEFVHLSLKALKKIAPFMEKGDRYDTAVKNAGYAHHSQLTGSTPLSAYLPAPDKNLIRNPVVYRALNQARKLINAIVREYGPPAAVHIELARDLSRSLEDRQDIQKGQKRFQTEKEKAGEAFMSVFGREPKGPDLLKYRLYREQDGQCAYSQEPIDAHRLLEPGYVEVDHILPYSRSFDNSQNNRVLVLGRENRNKGDQTPYEYMDGAHDSGRWRRFQAWVHANKKIRQAKRNRLFRADFSDGQAESFRERNISDTRYICRAFKEMLETSLQWDVRSDEVKANRCVVVSGELTAFLRARWGLVKKREEGDLHHALDAAIVAACGRAFVKRLADYSRENETKYVRHSRTDPDTGEITYHKALQVISTQAGKKPAFPAPWRTFRAELEARLSPNPAAQDMPDGYTEEEWRGVKPIRVSRAPTRRGLGAAHKETIRSIRYFTGETGDRTRRSSAVRVPLTELKEKDLDNIVGKDRDSVLFNAVSQRMTQFGFNAKKAFARPLYKTGDGEADAKGRAPQIRNVKIGQTQPSGVEVRGGVADNDSMIRADVFTKGEGRQKRFFVVPLYVSDVVKPQLPDRAVVQGKPEEEWDIVDDTYDFLFSLYPNDWLEVRLKDGVRAGYYGGLDRSTGAISLWTHDRDQRVGAKGLVRSIGIKTALELTKYHVDMLGNLHRVHREIRKPLSGKGG